MDYTNFIKNYYRVAITELNKFKEYNGIIVNVAENFDIPKEFTHLVQSNSMFLPNYEININAPVEFFVNFMEFYAKIMPALGYVLANKKRIIDLYNQALDIGVLNDDNSVLEYIKMIVEIGVEILAAGGILESENSYGDQI